MRLVVGLVLALCLFCGGSGFSYEGKTVSLAVGAKLLTDIVRRGARIYDGVQASPIVYVGLFDDRIQFLVNSLEYADFVYSDIVRLRTKIGSISDRPLLKTAGPLTIRNSRQSSWEWTTRAEVFFPNYKLYWGQIDLSFSKDIKAHGGHYLELTGRVTLARLYFENDKPKLQPQFFATLGWGDGRHNEYLYGTAGQVAGFNHVAYGLMIVAPARIDPHYAILQLYRYDVLGGANRSGALVSQTSGYHLDVTFALGIL